MEIDYSAMAFPKEVWKHPVRRKNDSQKKRKPRKYRKIPSILQDKSDKRCYLCMLLDENYREHAYVEEHHVIFGDNKWISDAYGLRVNLCADHHRTSPAAVHNNHDNAELLMRIAQRSFMEHFRENWMQLVKKNYL